MLNVSVNLCSIAIYFFLHDYDVLENQQQFINLHQCTKQLPQKRPFTVDIFMLI